MSDATVRTGRDVRVASSAPAANYPTGRQLRVQGTTQYSYVYLRNPVPKGAAVLSATLYLYGVGADGLASTVSVTRVAEPWGEKRTTWNEKPAVTGSAATLTASQTVDGQEWAFDVQAQLQALDGAGGFGWRVSTSSSNERRFWSLDSADHRPVLVVEWSDAPDAPTELSPSGGSAVSVAKPVLTFNFHDVSGSTAMAACRVQINPTNDFTAPAFDTETGSPGGVLTSDPELDLSTTTYAGIAAGASAYWRVQVQDAAGVWGDWSDPALFTRVAKGSLTINSPTGGVVGDPTQTVLWTLTGETQTAWQLTVADDADPTRPVLDTGRRSGTTSSYTIPKGVITDESTTYRLTLRTWGEPTRVSTPGDPVYMQAVETFIYAEDGTVTPVTGLTAAQPTTGQPQVVLTWSRATAPDSFVIVRGTTVVDVVDPADVLLTGTTYQYVDRSAGPHKSHTWKVRAKVAGKTSTSPTVTYAYDVEAIWLVDVDTGRSVPVVFLDGGGVEFAMPGTAGTYRAIDADTATRITQSVGALEGTVNGYVTEGYGDDADAWAANLDWFRRHPETVLRMTIGALNMPVVIGDVVIAPQNVGTVQQNGDDRAVAFGFWTRDGRVR